MLFSIGIDDTKAMSLIQALDDFKSLYDANVLVKDILPNIYAHDPKFYETMRVQELAEGIHRLICKHNLL